MDINKIIEAIGEIIATEVNVAVYQSGGDVPRVDEAGLGVCSVKFFNLKQLGLAEVDYRNKDLDVEILYSNRFEITLTLDFQKINSFQNAWELKQKLYKNSVSEACYKADIAFVSATDPVNVTETFIDKPEERTTMDIVIRVVGVTEELVRSIQELELHQKTEFFSHNLDSTIRIKP